MEGLLEFNVGELFPSDRISIKIQRVGQEYCEPRKKHETRNWDSLMSIHFVLFGHGTLITGDGEKISLSRGDVFMMYSGQSYEYYPDPVDPWSYTWVDFYSDNVQAWLGKCGFTVKKPYVHVNDFSAMVDLLKMLYEAYDTSETQYLSCSAYFSLILTRLIKNANRAQAPASQSVVKQRRVREILTYLNNNYRMDLSVKKIALDNCLSVSRMMAIFAEVVKMSPLVYVNRFRISEACRLLRDSDASIAEIGVAVGIEDQLYFARVFKKYKGISPREYRNRKIDEDPYAWMKEGGIDYR